MYVSPQLSRSLEPGLVGFRSNADIWNIDATQIVYPEDASRFEFSTMAYGCAIGLTVAIEFLNHVGIETIFDHNQSLADALIGGLLDRGVDVTSPQSPVERSAIVTAQFTGMSASDVTERFKESDIRVACRQDVVRFSPHLYNEMGDIEAALACVDAIVA